MHKILEIIAWEIPQVKTSRLGLTNVSWSDKPYVYLQCMCEEFDKMSGNEFGIKLFLEAAIKVFPNNEHFEAAQKLIKQ